MFVIPVRDESWAGVERGHKLTLTTAPPSVPLHPPRQPASRPVYCPCSRKDRQAYTLIHMYMTGHTYSSARTLFQPSPTCRPHDVCFIYSLYFILSQNLVCSIFIHCFFFSFMLILPLESVHSIAFSSFFTCALVVFAHFLVDTMPTEFAIQHIS